MKSSCRVTHSTKAPQLYAFSFTMQGHSYRGRRLIRLDTRRQSPPATADWLEANGWKTPLQSTHEELLLQYLLYKAATHYSRRQRSLYPYRTYFRSLQNAQQGVSALWCTPTLIQNNWDVLNPSAQTSTHMYIPSSTKLFLRLSQTPGPVAVVCGNLQLTSATIVARSRQRGPERQKLFNHLEI